MSVLDVLIMLALVFAGLWLRQTIYWFSPYNERRRSSRKLWKQAHKRKPKGDIKK